MSLIQRITQPGPKKLLAVDGGGIRGVLALEILQRIEDLLRSDGRGESFRLADYFDYIAGTSTGGIIAAGLSMGMSVKEILAFYETCGAQMFVRANILERLRYKFESEPLALELKNVFGTDTGFGSDRLQTLLLLVMRNATTDSPWPLSNNPYGKYNGRARPDDNSKIPLWQLVRASTAAPTYFPPEVIMLPGEKEAKGKQFVFVDGGVTMYNNPTFQMFLMATVDRYWAGKPEARWQTGADKMLIVSVGTGTTPNVQAGLDPSDMNLLFNATTIPSALMFAASNEQDLLCRVFGDCRGGDAIDREIGDLIGNVGPLEKGEKLFSYVRYNVELTQSGLDTLGLPHIKPEMVQKMDAIDSISDLREVGRKAADRVKKEHLAGF
ncbi:patatin-like phospholipase family protein [Rhizobium sp. WYCCWR 11290]|uniref:Patatin-like phospholipase family protein n=1 Tax=Rhizobium changzhiense TaxID=2692317 RepID=A0A7Z0ZW72_9HYPH|nr:patatin-like phospholipase family protein [Rhizobium changzhiense]NZD66264.1 patatin-like phospholipase family protein [Rhizobium changzhiense]